jgi:hypothetical protein
MCPVSLLIALAVADGAFTGLGSAADFDRIRYQEGRLNRQLTVKDSMRKVPVLRRLQVDRVISPNLIIPAEKISLMMKELGHRAGYTEDFVPYAIRRGFGNTIDRKSISRSIQRWY